MPNPGQELASLDFGNLIGAPLVAVIEAQARAAMTSTDFITNVGFSTDATTGVRTPATVAFVYKKTTVDAATGVSTEKDTTLSVPLLTILPVPFIRVDNAEIAFNAKITTVEYKDLTDEKTININASAKARWGFGSAKISGSYAQKTTARSGEKVEKDFTMSVKVTAVQDEMPAGLDRLLSILESSITEKTS